MKRKPRVKPETVTVGNVMVRIYKRQRPTTTGKRRTVFEVADYASGIRRLRGFTEHSDARAEAEKIANQLSSGRHHGDHAWIARPRATDALLSCCAPLGAALEVAAAFQRQGV